MKMLIDELIMIFSKIKKLKIILKTSEKLFSKKNCSILSKYSIRFFLNLIILNIKILRFLSINDYAAMIIEKHSPIISKTYFKCLLLILVLKETSEIHFGIRKVIFITLIYFLYKII